MWYIYPKNNLVSNAAFEAGIDLTPRTLDYKGEEIKNLIKVDIDFIKYWEGAVKDGGIDWFKVDLYSKDKNGIVRKYKFPRTKHAIDEMDLLHSLISMREMARRKNRRKMK